MAHLQLDFRTLTLFEDEEAGDTHVAVYAVIRDNAGNELATFASNFGGGKIDEGPSGNPAIWDLTDAVPHVFEIPASPVTVTVSAFADDDNSWPSASSNENALGSASTTIDAQNQGTLGSLIIGPTRTDQGNTGYQVNVEATVVPDRQATILSATFDKLLLFEDEEAGDTHVALYVGVQSPAPGTNGICFRWNNGGGTVDEGPSRDNPNIFDLRVGGSENPVSLTLFGPAVMFVEAYADDDNELPSAGEFENYLGSANITIDPDNPGTFGQRQLGPTITDNRHTGYRVDMVITSI